ncbi:cupin domain-containing protein [Thalassospira sp.]|uniref:AraC family transcriptional regulator n=1 Tax=Thalassospira sp. TaxID=1912094 RepID=UPI003AA7F7D9
MVDADIFRELSEFLRVRPVLDDYCLFGGDWRAFHEHDLEGCAYFHLVLAGNCFLERLNCDPIALSKGDIVLLPHGSEHSLGSGTDTSNSTVITDVRQDIRIKTIEGIDVTTKLVCGRLFYSTGASDFLVRLLPEVVISKTIALDTECRHEWIVSNIATEIQEGRPGWSIVAANFASALFTTVLRDHFERHPVAEGVFSLLANNQTRKAVIAMLHNPAHPWSLDELAAVSVTSRASLVRAFSRAGNIAPLGFLMRLRLGIARQKLSSGSTSLGQIAEDVGYQSEAAFSRAFFREFGVRPGQWREFPSKP